MSINRMELHKQGKLKSKFKPKVKAVISERDLLEHESRKNVLGVQLANNCTLTRINAGPLLYCHTNETCFTNHIVAGGFWESWITLFFKKLVKPEWTCVDVGCHVGYYTVLFKYWGVNKVISIDVNKKSCELLQRSLIDNGFENVRIIHGAAWSKDNELIEIASNPANPFNTRASEKDKFVKNDKSIGTINTVTLDTLLQNEERIDLIKIDAEGGESYIWQGMQQIINKFNPRILVEIVGNRKYYPTFLDEIAARYILRVVGYDGNLQFITLNELKKFTTDVMLYLSAKD